MTYGRALNGNPCRYGHGAVVSHSAELVRGDLLHFLGRPLAETLIGILRCVREGSDPCSPVTTAPDRSGATGAIPT